LSALLTYLEARAKLFQLEGRETTSRLITIATLAALALSLLITGWLIAMPALIWLAAEHLHWHWSRIALATAAAHLLLVLILLAALKNRLSRLQPFRESIRQLEQDRQCFTSPHA
jgi:uncharacterized membrane protein YqjE